MKVIVDGDINKYYVQMLCMIFFPGAKFAEDEEESPEIPTLEVKVVKEPNGVYANAELWHLGRICSSKKYQECPNGIDIDKKTKFAVGSAVLAAAGELTGYRPSWGMLTGVRPSKVATDLLNSGVSKTRVKKILTSDYLAIPKKAALALDVALNERRIIGVPDGKDCSV